MHGQNYVDVNMAYARWLADQREAQPYRLANAQVPATMLEFLEGGPSTMAAARRAIDYAVMLGPSSTGPAGETICLSISQCPDRRASSQSAFVARLYRF